MLISKYNVVCPPPGNTCELGVCGGGAGLGRGDDRLQSCALDRSTHFKCLVSSLHIAPLMSAVGRRRCPTHAMSSQKKTTAASKKNTRPGIQDAFANQWQMQRADKARARQGRRPSRPGPDRLSLNNAFQYFYVAAKACSFIVLGKHNHVLGGVDEELPWPQWPTNVFIFYSMQIAISRCQDAGRGASRLMLSLRPRNALQSPPLLPSHLFILRYGGRGHVTRR